MRREEETSNVQRSTSKSKKKSRKKQTRVFGFTGPGGAGKTTLIDELVLRLLHREPKARIAILSHDPSVVGAGALLGRSGDDDQFAERTRLYAEHGHARTSRRAFAGDRRLSAASRAIRF